MIILGRDELVDVPLAWPVVSSTVLARGKITSYVPRSGYGRLTGNLIARKYLKHPALSGSSRSMIMTGWPLVRQYRHPVRHRLIEPPAGLLDVGGGGLPAGHRAGTRRRGGGSSPWRSVGLCWSTCSPRRESSANHRASISPATWPMLIIRTVSPGRAKRLTMDTVWASLDDLVEAVARAAACTTRPLCSGVLAAWTARQRDGFTSLRPADADWPARDLIASSEFSFWQGRAQRRQENPWDAAPGARAP
mgnify:CR=1 FL=1